MSGKIVIAAIGGLGNQMFQYALYRYLSSKGIRSFIDPSWYSGSPLCRIWYKFSGLKPHETFRLADYFDLPDLKIIEEKEAEKIERKYHFIEKKDNHDFYLNMINSKTNAYLTGFYQVCQPASAVRQLLYNDFAFKKPIPDSLQPILQDIENSNSVSIHVRRGDDVDEKEAWYYVGFIRNMGYYKNGIDYLKERYKNLRFFIFSDDIPWVTENFSFLENYCVVDTRNISSSTYYDLLLMSRCKHNIIANSTFSWWAAFLNQNPEKTVIVPEVWQRTTDNANIDTICPPGWIRVPIWKLPDAPNKVYSDLPIVFSTDDYYLPYMSCMIQSIMENAGENNRYHFYTLYQRLDEDDIEKVRDQVHNFEQFSVDFIDVSVYIAGKNFYTTTVFSEEIYFRLLIPYILPQYDKVLYLDGDMICHTDIAEIFKTDMEDKLLCAVNDFGALNWIYDTSKEKFKRSYFDVIKKMLPSMRDYVNSGMLLFNTSAVRNFISLEKLLEYAVKTVHDVAGKSPPDSCFKTCPDQDVINLLFNGKIKYLPFQWNFETENHASLPADLQKEYDEAKNSIKIMHFAGAKPWKHPFATKYSSHFWHYAAKTMFFEEILGRYQHFLLENNNIQHGIIHRKSYRIFMKLTWFPRKLRSFLRRVKKKGVRFTMKLLLRKINNRVFIPRILENAR
ncbi:MAG: alpha-1,2-fucosyltransferase [Treponema sp.]|jgi:lipopolysaccharide biosynthesis glycosyltransferase|nr:alpha-1,2-fucosyltransferase [Treponema sp.]